MIDFNTAWEWVKTLGPGGAALCLMLWLDERRERREIQRHITTLHRENIKRLEKLLREVARLNLVMAARVSSIVKSGKSKRISGK